MARGRARRALVAAALAAALSGVAGTARAEEGGGARLAVVTIAGAQASRERADEVARALLPEGREGVLGPEEARQALGRKGGPAALAAARRLTVRARRELDSFEDLEAAARLLDRAAQAHLALLPLLESVEEPVRLLVEAATVRLAMGETEGMDRALGEAVRLDPALDLDPSEVPRRLARAAAAAREAGAEASVLAPETARRLADALGAARLLVVQPRPGPRTVVVELYEGGTGERAGRWSVEDMHVETAAAGLEAIIGPEEPDEGAPAAAPGEGGGAEAPGADGGRGSAPARARPASPDPWYRRWWVWTIIAVVAAGAAAGVVLTVLEAQEPLDVGLEVRRGW